MNKLIIDKQDLDQIRIDLSENIQKIQGARLLLDGISPDELEARHNDWIDLYQMGENIKYLAEQLDSVYQAQFSASPAREPEERLYCWHCGRDTGQVKTDENTEALCDRCLLGDPIF